MGGRRPGVYPACNRRSEQALLVQRLSEHSLPAARRTWLPSVLDGGGKGWRFFRSLDRDNQAGAVACLQWNDADGGHWFDLRSAYSQFIVRVFGYAVSRQR